MTEAEAQERELVERSRGGDLAAFNRLVQIHQRAVYNLCLRLLGSHTAAEDAAQEAFIAAFRHIKGFRGGSFPAWLFRIAANASYDELRRRRRRPVTLEQEAAQNLPAEAPTHAFASPEAYVQQREQAQLLQQGLASLPQDQRLAVILCDVQGLSYEEIAAATGASLGTVKSRISRGREKLRHFLRERWEL